MNANCVLFQKWKTQHKDFVKKGGMKPQNEFPEFFNSEIFKPIAYWKGFVHETIHNNKHYFAKVKDVLEINYDVITYQVNLDIKDRIGKIIFEMLNPNEKEYKLLETKVFIPKMNLEFPNSIIYTQNKKGLGIKDSNEILTFNNESCFYFKAPFSIYMYVDTLELLAIYVDDI